MERCARTLATGEAYHSLAARGRAGGDAGLDLYDWKIERIALPDRRLGVQWR